MRFLHNLPLKRKLTAISLLTSGIALLLTCAAFIVYEQVSFRGEQARELETAAHIIGANSASSLAFDDNDTATLTLKSLEQQPRIVRACLYDDRGNVFATYQRDPWAALAWPQPRADTVYLDSDSLDLFEAVRSGGDVVGTLYIESDLDELIARRWHYLGIGAAVFFAAILLTWLIASRLQRLISEPISELAAIAGRVGAEKAYSIRATKLGDDEIGRLIDGFNHMLAQIEIRDAELKATHRDLEHRVEERTRSLETATQELLVEKARFQFIFDHAPVGITLHSSEEGRLRSRMINEAHLGICGLTRADLGEDFSIFRKITHPDDLARQLPFQEKIERGEISGFSLEKRYIRPDGKTVWVVFTTQRIDFPNGRVEAMSTISDITALKEAELETAQQRERFKFIFDSLPVGVSLYSQLPQDGYSFLINDAQLEIIGVTRDEVMVDLTIFNRLTHPEDYERQLPLRQKLKANEIDRYSLEKRYIRPGGETVWVSFYTQRKTYPNGRVETLSVVVDITGLKRAQEEAAREQARLKFIFDSVPVGISLYSGTKDDPRRSFLINDAHLDICGVTRGQVAANEGIFGEITHPDDAARQRPLTEALNAGRLPRYTVEKRYIRPDGRVVWATFSAQRMVYPDGRVETLGTVVDVTELKLAQEESALERERFKFIFDSVPVGISLASHGKDGGTQSYLINDAHLEISGVTRAQAVETRGAAIRDITHPEDLQRQAPLDRALNDQEISHFSVEKRYLRPDGSLVWVVFSKQRAVYPDGRVEMLASVVDITQLKLAQEAAAHEQSRLKFIFDYIPVGISLETRAADRSTRSFLINDSHLRICGVGRDEVGDNDEIFARITHPDDQARQKPLNEALDAGDIPGFSIDKRYIRADGSIVWVTVSAQRMVYPDGRVEILGTVTDITALKRAQEAAAREQARFKFIFDSLPVGVSWRLLGPETLLLNPAHEKITGVSAQLAVSDPGAFARVTHPEDAQRQVELADRMKRGEIDQFVVEKRYIHPDGRIVWAVMMSRVSTDLETGNIQSVTTLVDITDLKLAQEEVARERARFKFIFDALPVGVAWMVYDRPETRIVNPSCVSITGVPAERCHELERYVEATHPDDRATQAALREKLRAGEIDQYSLEKRYLHPGGVVRWASLHVRTVRQHGDEAQELATVVDITERKKAEDELEDVHKQLLRTSHQAGMAEVATGVLHNVGNVLNSVNVSATLVADLVRRSKSPNVGKLSDLLNQNRADLGRFMVEDPRGKVIPTYLGTLAEALAQEQKTILHEIESLHKNIGHIKDIVAMQQSYAKTSGVVETVSVPDLVEDALRMNAGSLARHDVEVVREYEARPVITVEKNKVLQILVNLIRNAKYACDESGRTDKRLVVRSRADASGVDIAVIDNGVGIPAENLTRIFNHGFTTRKQGHGFGLHSGALAAKEMGGALDVHSDGPGCGAAFTLRLPFAPVARHG